MSTYPEPHEGVVGTERPDDPVLAHDGAYERIADLALRLYRATLVGNPAPAIVYLHQRLTHPIPGDLVIVRDAVGHRDPLTRRRGVGYLVVVRREWWSTYEEWDAQREDLDDERIVEPQAWYVQYGPHAADICRWTNCTVLAVPEIGELT